MRLLVLPILLTAAAAIIQKSDSRYLSNDSLGVRPLRSDATETPPNDQPTLHTVLEARTLPKACKGKSKRNANRRSWSVYKSYNDPPPYLVFNRKIGAYYPYYSFPAAGNSVRRSRLRKVGRQ